MICEEKFVKKICPKVFKVVGANLQKSVRMPALGSLGGKASKNDKIVNC